jgi:hypothetical protein
MVELHRQGPTWRMQTPLAARRQDMLQGQGWVSPPSSLEIFGGSIQLQLRSLTYCTPDNDPLYCVASTSRWSEETSLWPTVAVGPAAASQGMAASGAVMM